MQMGVGDGPFDDSVSDLTCWSVSDEFGGTTGCRLSNRHVGLKTDSCPSCLFWAKSRFDLKCVATGSVVEIVEALYQQTF